jgi:hypothetical protein
MSELDTQLEAPIDVRSVIDAYEEPALELEPQTEVSALPEDDLQHYDGRWVALRDGKVVAHAADMETLQADPAVQPSDDVFPVGDPPTGFYTVCA